MTRDGSSAARDVSFGGARVVLLESRLAEQTASMVRRFGGEPVVAPALAEVDVDDDAGFGECIDRLEAARHPVVILLTGAAVTKLFAAADRMDRGDALSIALGRATTVARGPKPAGALARRSVSSSVTVPEPFTTASVIASLAGVAVEGRDAFIVHYGERSEPIVAYLRSRQATVHELLLYVWRLPDDTRPLSDAIDAIVGGKVGVVAFTSQVQVRHLLEVAGPGRRCSLIHALNDRVLVGAVGPTCAAACVAAGIHGAVVPDTPKLAPLLTTLAARHAAAIP